MRPFSTVILITLLFALSPLQAQKVRLYKAKVTLNDDNRVKGILYSANEEGLLLMDKKLVDTIRAIDHRSIKSIKLRRSGRVGRSALIGASGGALLGAVLGLAEGDDSADCWIFCYTAEEKALAGAVVLAIPGAGIGALIGTESKKYEINGNTSTYNTYISELRSMAVK